MRFGRPRGNPTAGTRSIGTLRRGRSTPKRPRPLPGKARSGGVPSEAPRVRDGKSRRNDAAWQPSRAGTVLVGKIVRSGLSQRARGRSGPGSPDRIRTSFPDQPSPAAQPLSSCAKSEQSHARLGVSAVFCSELSARHLVSGRDPGRQGFGGRKNSEAQHFCEIANRQPVLWPKTVSPSFGGSHLPPKIS